MALKNQNLDDYLNEQNLEEQFEKKGKKSNKEKNEKNIVKRIFAVVVAGALAVCATFGLLSLGKKNKNKTNTISTYPSITQEDNTNINTNTNNIDNNIENNKTNNSLNDLGIPLEFPKEENKPQYQNPSNDKIDINKIVEDNDGTLWVDEEAKEESVNIGKVEIDTKDDTLVVKPDGNVYEIEVGFEITNDKDVVISSGNVNEEGIPDGYVEDPTTGDLYKENVYIASDGTVWESEGRYEAYLESLKNTGETVIVESVPVQDNTNSDSITSSDEITDDITIEQIINEGVVNSDGTYTIYGTTYESKADYEQFLLTPEEYVYYNGKIVSLNTIEENNKQLTLK